MAREGYAIVTERFVRNIKTLRFVCINKDSQRMGCNFSKKETKTDNDIVVIPNMNGLTNVVEMGEFRKAAQKPGSKYSATLLERLIEKNIITSRFNKQEIKALTVVFQNAIEAEESTNPKTTGTKKRFSKRNRLMQTISGRRRSSMNHLGGSIKLDTFQRIFGIESDLIAERTFKMFDTDNSGDLSLHEFIIGYSMWKEKLETDSDKQILAFNIFDCDEDGKLNRQEFKNMLRATRKLADFHIPTSSTNATKELAEHLFKACGGNIDDSSNCLVSYSKLLEIVSNSHMFKRMLDASASDIQVILKVEFEYVENGFMISLNELIGVLTCVQANKLRPLLETALEDYTDRTFGQGQENDAITFEEFKTWVNSNPETVDYIAASTKTPKSRRGSLDAGNKVISVSPYQFNTKKLPFRGTRFSSGSKEKDLKCAINPAASSLTGNNDNNNVSASPVVVVTVEDILLKRSSKLHSPFRARGASSDSKKGVSFRSPRASLASTSSMKSTNEMIAHNITRIGSSISCATDGGIRTSVPASIASMHNNESLIDIDEILSNDNNHQKVDNNNNYVDDGSGSNNAESVNGVDEILSNGNDNSIGSNNELNAVLSSVSKAIKPTAIKVSDDEKACSNNSESVNDVDEILSNGNDNSIGNSELNAVLSPLSQAIKSTAIQFVDALLQPYKVIPEVVIASEPETVSAEVVISSEPETVSAEVVISSEPETVSAEVVISSEPETVSAEVVISSEPETVSAEVVISSEPETVSAEVVISSEPETVSAEVVIASEPETVSTEAVIESQMPKRMSSKCLKQQLLWKETDVLPVGLVLTSKGSSAGIRSPRSESAGVTLLKSASKASFKMISAVAAASYRSLRIITTSSSSNSSTRSMRNSPMCREGGVVPASPTA